MIALVQQLDRCPHFNPSPYTQAETL